MADFKIKTEALQDAQSSLEHIQSTLRRYEGEIRSVAAGLNFKIAASGSMRAKINTIAGNVNVCSANSKSMSSAAEKIYGKYVSVENEIKNEKKKESSERNDKKTEPKGFWFHLLSFFEGWEYGFIGKGVSSSIQILKAGANGDVWGYIKNVRAGWKNIVKLNKYGKNMSKVKRMIHPDTCKASWAEHLFGFNNYFDKTTGVASRASKFSTRVYNNFHKATIKEVAKVGWVDVLFSGVTNAISNYNEHKSGKISAQRAVAETATETGIDVVKNVALMAGSAALVASIAPAAPVIVVSAVAAVAGMTLDAVAKWATNGEKGFTEVVSDAVLDTGKAIADAGKKTFDYLGEQAKKVGNAISKAWDSIRPKWNFGFA